MIILIFKTQSHPTSIEHPKKKKSVNRISRKQIITLGEMCAIFRKDDRIGEVNLTMLPKIKTYPLIKCSLYVFSSP